jgi:uncharacterized protein (TIGR02453 family)
VTAFAGFVPEAFGWFAGLEAENTREWFAAHRDTYEDAVRGAFEAMLLELADDLGGDVKLFRQHRDLRFSADKSPYKTRTYGLIHDRPENRPTLYAQISATGLFAGSGYYRLAADSSPASATRSPTTAPARRSRRPSPTPRPRAPRRTARC